MKTKNLRIVLPLALLALIAVGFATQGGIGTPSAFGWQDIALLCPLGALTTMLASKMLVPRAVISLVVVLALVLIVGRLFCAWLCPVPVVSKLRGLFGGKKSANEADGAVDTPVTAADGAVIEPLTAEEKKALAAGCKGEGAKGAKGKGGCGSCAEKRQALTSRYFVLGGALASAAVFGFPVFCLVCPIGLTCAAVLLTMRMFGVGDVTWSLVVVLAVLVLEVVVFRRWCHTFCPVGALMSIVSKANRTFQPKIDAATCLETTKGAHCGRCAEVCPEGIDLRHLAASAPISECTRCRACSEVCPSGAISFSLIARKGDGSSGGGVRIVEADFTPSKKDGVRSAELDRAVCVADGEEPLCQS